MGAGKASLAQTGMVFIKPEKQSVFGKLAFPHSYATSVENLVRMISMPLDDASWLQVNGQPVSTSARYEAKLAFNSSGCSNLYQFLFQKYLRNDVHSLSIIHFAFRKAFRESSGVDLALEGKYTIGSLSFYSMFVSAQCSRSSTFAPHVSCDPLIRRILQKATMGGLTACSRFFHYFSKHIFHQ